jgi:hypothetical protein
MQQKRQKQQSQQIFTASEVAEYEYCPLVWWYERFEPMAQADTEELFACLVELEHEHDTQASALPEYRMVEQLLLRRGAFEQGQQLHQEHADEVAELEEERVVVPTTSTNTPRLLLLTVALMVVALILIVVSLVLR